MTLVALGMTKRGGRGSPAVVRSCQKNVALCFSWRLSLPPSSGVEYDVVLSLSWRPGTSSFVRRCRGRDFLTLLALWLSAGVVEDVSLCYSWRAHDWSFVRSSEPSGSLPSREAPTPRAPFPRTGEEAIFTVHHGWDIDRICQLLK